jgi:aspartyl-tRNA(Asn)/glutamyl-tRNA(Gln) amidotransferase subunit C
MSLTISEVEKLANLSQIALHENEKNQYQKDLETILEYVGMIGELEVEGVEEMVRVDDTPHMRADIPTLGSVTDSLVQKAPEVIGEFIIAPGLRDGE